MSWYKDAHKAVVCLVLCCLKEVINQASVELATKKSASL